MSFDRHDITREIGIDMGHRVTLHGSKCRNLHGHRYTIQATLNGPLARGGEQDGMVMDFGFIKDVMMEVIDRPFDHGLCLWVEDPLLSALFPYEVDSRLLIQATRQVETDGMAMMVGSFGKVVILHCTPTAENLARVWWEMLSVAMGRDERNRGATLTRVRVYETPNCWADYAPNVVLR